MYPVPPQVNPKSSFLKLHKKLILIIALVVLFIVIAGIILSNKIFVTKKLPSIDPSPTPKAQSIILYPENPSPDGRDIYYSTAKSYPGAGYYPMTFARPDYNTKPVPMELTSYIVGSFVKWENIPNSPDKYLILKSNIQPDYKVDLPKIRIGFNKTLNFKDRYYTAFGIEDLSTIIPTIKEPGLGAKTYLIDYIASFSTSDLSLLIKPNDALVITILRDPREKTRKVDLVDYENNKVAEWLYIRRFNPKETLSKELNRSIVLK